MSTKAQTDFGHPGEGPYTYTVLTGDELQEELARHAQPVTIANADAVTFQPYPGGGNQDRYVVQQWSDVAGKLWEFAAVFDGHGGEETAKHLVNVLPPMIKNALGALSAAPESPSVVSDILSAQIQAFDASLEQDLFSIFPDGVEELAPLSDEHISARINNGGENIVKAQRCRHGSTVLVSLLDREAGNLWIASVGDCNAILATESGNGSWDISLLSANHNGKDKAEADRIRAEHPNEDGCVKNDRVLGAIAVTRAVGDHHFKLPLQWTKRVLMNLDPPLRFSYITLEDFVARSITPPYLTSLPDVRHAKISSTPEKTRKFLIMSSDGLYDLRLPLFPPAGDIENAPVEEIAKGWVEAIASAPEGQNAALAALRQGLGGSNEEKVAQMLTVELPGKWTDDVTVIVQRL